LVFSELEHHELADAAGSLGISRTRFVFRFLKNWFLEWLAGFCPVPSWRASLHRWRGVQIGNNAYIGYGVIIDRVYPDKVSIEDFAVVADRCIITAHGCGSIPLQHLYPRQVKPVRIGRGAWLSPACIVIMGVEIGEEAVIGTGAVVTRSIPPRSVAIGVPARVIKTLDPSIPAGTSPDMAPGTPSRDTSGSSQTDRSRGAGMFVPMPLYPLVVEELFP
jgi:acetyltransferase-like isoleucine patch superfamily enzyme